MTGLSFYRRLRALLKPLVQISALENVVLRSWWTGTRCRHQAAYLRLFQKFD